MVLNQNRKSEMFILTEIGTELEVGFVWCSGVYLRDINYNLLRYGSPKLILK
jgi:hypothetical protein